MIQFICEFGDTIAEAQSDYALPTGWVMISIAMNPPQPAPLTPGREADISLVMAALPAPVTQTGHVCPNHTTADIQDAMRRGWQRQKP